MSVEVGDVVRFVKVNGESPDEREEKMLGMLGMVVERRESSSQPLLLFFSKGRRWLHNGNGFSRREYPANRCWWVTASQVRVLKRGLKLFDKKVQAEMLAVMV